MVSYVLPLFELLIIYLRRLEGPPEPHLVCVFQASTNLLHATFVEQRIDRWVVITLCNSIPGTSPLVLRAVGLANPFEPGVKAPIVVLNTMITC